MSRADDLGRDVARSGMVRREKTKWTVRYSMRVRPRLSEDQRRLALLTPEMAEEARRQALKAKFMSDWERQCAEETAGYRASREAQKR